MKRFKLTPKDGSIPAFTPGQFVFLHRLDSTGASVLKRPYSIASAPSVKELEFAIGMIGGAFTGWLAEAVPGDTLGVEGPLGRMRLEGTGGIAFICGGTGVAPAMSMIKHLIASGSGRTFTLFYSVRSPDRILFRDELAVASRHPGMEIVITATREAPEGWEGERGRLCHTMMAKHIHDPSSVRWYICGPNAMIRQMRDCLDKMGVPKESIEIEGWG